MSSEDSDEDDNENQDQGAPLPDLSDPDFAQFVQYLGCDEETLQQDDDFTQGTLLRIMQEAYIAPLPPNWAEFSDPEGRIYFYNYATEQSSWAHPTDRTYRELIQVQFVAIMIKMVLKFLIAMLFSKPFVEDKVDVQIMQN